MLQHCVSYTSTKCQSRSLTLQPSILWWSSQLYAKKFQEKVDNSKSVIIDEFAWDADKAENRVLADYELTYLTY